MFDVFGLDLFVSMFGLMIAGFTAVLGIWIERDRSKPPFLAILLSVLIFLAMSVEIGRSFFEELRETRLQNDMKRILDTLEIIAEDSGDENLSRYVKGQRKRGRRGAKGKAKGGKAGKATGGKGSKTKGKKSKL